MKVVHPIGEMKYCKSVKKNCDKKSNPQNTHQHYKQALLFFIQIYLE